MAEKKRVTLYVTKETYDRARDALEREGESISAYVDDYLARTLPLLEASSDGELPEEKAQAFLAAGGQSLLEVFIEFGDALRTAQEVAEGKEVPQKAKK